MRGHTALEEKSEGERGKGGGGVSRWGSSSTCRYLMSSQDFWEHEKMQNIALKSESHGESIKASKVWFLLSGEKERNFTLMCVLCVVTRFIYCVGRM